MRVQSLDHLVLTVEDVARTAVWYEQVLGMRVVKSDTGRTSLLFGSQKINLHPASGPYSPHAAHPTPGSADLCFLTDTTLEEVAAHLSRCGVPIEEGPVERIGAIGPMRSLYIRDPGANLIEISVPIADEKATSRSGG